MSELPIVQFGKYKGKSILELLGDEKYLEWCKSQPGMLEKYPAVFNIIYQQSNKSNDAPTPEHNKLQNMFLNKNIQLNLIKYLRNNDINFLNELFENEEYKKYFKPNKNRYDIIKDFLNENNIKFEAENNWDIKLNGMINIIFFEFNNEQYDNIKQEFIKNSNKVYTENLKKYENKFMEIYNEDNPLKFIESCNKENPFKKELMECYHSMYLYIKKHYVNDFDINCIDIGKINSYMNKVNSLFLKDYNLNKINYEEINSKNSTEFLKDFKGYTNNFYYKFLKKNLLDKINYMELYIGNDSGRTLIGRSEDDNLYYRNDYKYFKIDYNLLPVIYCEIKPILGDDYPCVLRKMSNQIKLRHPESKYDNYCLIIDKFNSSVTSFDELKTIFNQHNIKVILTSEIFGDDFNFYLTPEQLKIKELEEEVKQLKEKLNMIN